MFNVINPFSICYRGPSEGELRREKLHKKQSWIKKYTAKTESFEREQQKTNNVFHKLSSIFNQKKNKFEFRDGVFNKFYISKYGDVKRKTFLTTIEVKLSKLLGMDTYDAKTVAASVKGAINRAKETSKVNNKRSSFAHLEIDLCSALGNRGTKQDVLSIFNDNQTFINPKFAADL